MSRKNTMQDCCVITVGHVQLLLPATDGLKVMALLRNAVEVEYDWDADHRRHWNVGERPRCEMQMVSPKDLRPKVEPPAPAPRKPRLLGHG